jgi:hypothetical protein
MNPAVLDHQGGFPMWGRSDWRPAVPQTRRPSSVDALGRQTRLNQSHDEIYMPATVAIWTLCGFHLGFGLVASPPQRSSPIRRVYQASNEHPHSQMRLRLGVPQQSPPRPLLTCQRYSSSPTLAPNVWSLRWVVGWVSLGLVPGWVPSQRVRALRQNCRDPPQKARCLCSDIAFSV